MNEPGLIAVLTDGRLYVVPNPLLCTGRTTKGKRCSFNAWPAEYCGEWAYIVSRDGALYAIDAPAAFLTKARVQRCDRHATPDAPEFCAPELEVFHPQRHAALVQPLTDKWVRL